MDRCSYNRSLAGRSGSWPRNNSMNRSRYNRAGSLRSFASFPGPVIVVVTRPDGRRIHGEWLPETRRIRFAIAFGAWASGLVSSCVLGGTASVKVVLNQRDASRSGSPGHGRVVRCGTAYGQLITAFVAVLNDGTYGLMGSLDVDDESRSFISGRGHNAGACSECVTAEPLPRKCGRMRERQAFRRRCALARDPLQLQSVVNGALRIEAS